MSPPWQALVAVSWAVVAPPLLVYAATRVRRLTGIYNYAFLYLLPAP